MIPGILQSNQTKGAGTMAAMNINAKKLMEMIESKKIFLVDFWAPWCPHCVKINPAYNLVAEQRSDTIEVVKLNMDEDEKLWSEFSLEYIPTLRLYVDGKAVASTVAPASKAAIDEFLSGILPEQKKQNDDHVYDMIVIGGGPAGYTAAIYGARADMAPVLYEGLQPGGQLTTTTDIENYPGFENGIGGQALMETMKAQAMRLGADLRVGTVTSADLSERPFRITVDGSKEILAETLIIATGATAKYLGLPSETRFKGLGVSACATCDGFFYRRKTVAVVGGGDTACEEATYLAGLCRKVYMIVRRDVLRASQAMQERVMATENIEILWNCNTQEILGDDAGVTGARLVRKDGEVFDIAVDGFFLAIGHHPNSELFSQWVKVDKEGYIITDGKTSRTNVDGVFAAGDVQDPLYRQAITAAASGCRAALDAEKFIKMQ